MLYGTKGSLSIPRDRSGQPLTLTLRHNGKDEQIPESAHLSLVPDFHLDATTAALFGGERLSSYTIDFADIDANLLAVELADFVDAITEDRAPEVTGIEGLRALAVVYGFLESARSGGTVFIDRFMQGEESSYFSEIETAKVAD